MMVCRQPQIGRVVIMAYGSDNRVVELRKRDLTVDIGVVPLATSSMMVALKLGSATRDVKSAMLAEVGPKFPFQAHLL